MNLSVVNGAPQSTRTRFLLVLEGPSDTIHDLRAALKWLLRARQLRCVDLKQLDYRNDSGSNEISGAGR